MSLHYSLHRTFNAFTYTAAAGLMALSLNVSASTSNQYNTHQVQQNTQQLQQNEESKAAAIGLGSGVVVGAIVAGPVGAAVAGIVGALLGENTAQENALQNNREALSKANDENTALLAANQSMQEQLMITKVAYSEELVQAPAPTLKSSIQFKSGSVVVEPAYQEQLSLIASALKGNEKLSIRLTGQADQRGDTQFNEALSMQRALSVKKELTQRGVSETQIMTVAVGESQSKQTEHEGIFFDRKVEMEIAERAPVLMSNSANY
ncbi:sortase-associated OmpA-like protein PdsO [Alteromonas sp. S167]|jgi:peptidoglycan-associated lipoprotein|uniref:sortase-associated OmpA-like protein PdsO n=1 Tax=Alteromonas sp. S167 TaxID=3117402 RepID=UPI002FDFFB17